MEKTTPHGRYAIIVQKQLAGGSWAKVVQCLEKKYQAKTFTYQDLIEEVRTGVAAYHPRWVCFVAPPTESFPELAKAANKFCRTLNDDPYVDAIWGILTGWDADHALELAGAEPIVINRAFTKTQVDWLNWVCSGDYVTEWTANRGELARKVPGKVFERRTGGPGDDVQDAQLVHKILTSDESDLLIGSGHGNPDRWQLMFPTGNGFLIARDGKLTVHAPGYEKSVSVKRAKVYWAVGNCLTGLINNSQHSYKNSYALAWMRNGVRQYLGAVKPTNYNLNWNMADWFLKQAGRWTFAESLFLLRQWSKFLLEENLLGAKEAADVANTDDMFVLYGDPALEARVNKAGAPALDETLQVIETADKGVYRLTYKVHVNFVGTGDKRTAEKYDGWRIFAHLLPFQVKDVKVEESDFAKVICPGQTLIWDAGKGLKEHEQRSVTLTVRRVEE